MHVGEGRNKYVTVLLFFFLTERRWLPVPRLSVKCCAKSDLSPDSTHLATIFLPSFLIRGGKSYPQCSHVFDMVLSPACLSGHAAADAYTLGGGSEFRGYLTTHILP